eukprot:4540281-Amphidinium_carterae.1
MTAIDHVTKFSKETRPEHRRLQNQRKSWLGASRFKGHRQQLQRSWVIEKESIFVPIVFADC